MAKRQRPGDMTVVRLFDVLDQSALAELPDSGFRNEAHMQKLVEANIEMLFSGLTFLTREFRGMGEGELRPDTIAFDTARNSFAALEYKNRQNMEAVDQARTYVDFMRRHKGDLAMLYNDQRAASRKSDSFDWKEIYAIIMAPDFTKYQISGAGKDDKVELYKIRMYDHVIMMERVGGGHPQTLAAPKPAQRVHSPKPQKNAESAATNASKGAKPVRNDIDGYVGLPDIRYEKGQSVPKTLTFPDGNHTILKSWTSILANVADWLVGKKYLDESHCPVPIGPKNAILNTRPVHQSGKQFRHSAKAGHLYVYLNVSPAHAISHAINLINMAGLNPNDFGISSDVPLAAPNHGAATDDVRRIETVQGGTGKRAALSDIRYEKGQNPPKNLTYSDGSQAGLKAWADILYNVANWLVGKDYLDELHCPVPKGPKNAILNTQPVHQNGKPFRRPQKAGYLYVDMNVDPKSAIFCAIKLIKVAELDPSDFKVHF